MLRFSTFMRKAQQFIPSPPQQTKLDVMQNTRLLVLIGFKTPLSLRMPDLINI